LKTRLFSLNYELKAIVKYQYLNIVVIVNLIEIKVATRKWLKKHMKEFPEKKFHGTQR
jgi:hypothetical protein